MPYGGTSVDEGSYNTNYRFTGKELDDETGLYFYGARYYNPLIGRFISADTIVQAPQNPQTLNRYSYCINNPINYTDPSGHSWWSKLWGQIVSAIVGIVTLVTTWNPVLAFQAYSLTNTVISTGQALASGVSIGRAFGSLAAGIGLSIVGAGLGIGDISNLALRMGAFALQGAAIGAAGAAIMGGDVGQGALWGAGFGAATGFLSSQQFTNYRNHGEFLSDKNFSHLNQKLSDMAGSIGGGTHEFGLLAGEAPSSSISTGHVGIETDFTGLGKYPSIEANETSWLLGKVVPGEIRPESAGFVSAAKSSGAYKGSYVNSFQHNRVIMQLNNPGAFSLATNCSPFALDTARFIGWNVPSNLTTYGFVNPTEVAGWLRSVGSWSADK